MQEARAGNIDTAARCELALLGIRDPTIEQRAGALLRAHERDDLRVLRTVYVKEG